MTTNNETAIADSLSAAPDVPWAAAAFDLVLSEENRPVANHSVRSWAFARLLRDHWTAGHGAQSQHAELFLANARLLLNSGN